jgi:hypothetical protein
MADWTKIITFLTSDAGKTLFSGVTTLMAVVGGVIALRNWRNAERWKRAELAASYLQPLFEDDELVFALRCLDWSVGTIPVPERHRAMMEGKETIQHDPALLVEAMRPKLTDRVAASPQGMLYRLALDALFTRFEWIAHRVGRGRRGLIRIEDIPDLRYWMEMLSDWPYAPNQTRSREVFIRFLKAAQYTATLRLIKRFGYFIESVEDRPI